MQDSLQNMETFETLQATRNHVSAILTRFLSLLVLGSIESFSLICGQYNEIRHTPLTYPS